MTDYIDSTARDDFNKARTVASFTRILNLFTPSRGELLSLSEVRNALRPRGERYQGMRTVPIARIVGSEGRYRDFTNQFLPRHEYLRSRWERVDKAHLKDVILPPISLYEIGGLYFVRDGNHRVSVAKTQGVISIDAEVVTLDTEIPIHDSLTRDALRSAIIHHEKEQFQKRTRFRTILDYDLDFSTTGRYDEIEQHILGHKYFLNEQQTVEIPMEVAMKSWYRNVFRPIVDVIEEQNLISRFPGRTIPDLYLWIVRHWDQLKQQYGEEVSVGDAAQDYSARYGSGFWKRFRNLFSFREKRNPPASKP